MPRRPPATPSAPPRRSVVAMIVLAAAMPLAAHLVPDLAAVCWSAGLLLVVVALVVAVRSHRRAG
ncbi:hypothetical protein [Clavibacter sp. VKM Ac-2872]|uniref:hypothetical protein n=1 Tax=Clavibacter sp. VKM Ac-2872 TaxID=2783812 RepID=UPI00188A9B88|nr:hypothetical protein [Clavibacter sp. VKM Ac-2872]MBF4625499.1 hypothetical protein [Clavibacter sp. VKM Ac-2872]